MRASGLLAAPAAAIFISTAILWGTALLLPGCSDETSTQPSPTPPAALLLGGKTTLEIMTWNLEWFPRSGAQTITAVRQIVDTLAVDLIAIQEIADTTAFRTLIDSLDGYRGLYSPDTYGDSYQKTGILYRQDIVRVDGHYALFTDDAYAFPRPPMRYALTAQKDGVTFDFVLIVVHLKAGSGGENIARRQAAAEELKEYVDARIAWDDEQDYIIAGDWNDEIDDPPASNAFTAFVDSPDHEFLTATLAGDLHNASYPSLGALIDHILISADVREEWAGGRIHTQRLDEVYSDYFRSVSDHLPVMATFPIFPEVRP